MEPNVDRGMWAIVVLLIAVVIGAATMMIFPDFVDRIGSEMTALMTNPSMIINKRKTGENVVLATDDDFSGLTDESFGYIGEAKSIEIPHEIKGVALTSCSGMVSNSNTKEVSSTNKNVTDMITDMGRMFHDSQASSLDLSSFDTSKVMDMWGMFYGSQAVEGYARSTSDALKFNNSSSESGIPLMFIVK